MVVCKLKFLRLAKNFSLQDLLQNFYDRKKVNLLDVVTFKVVL